MNLSEKLISFKIPAMRRDLTKSENILWLARNLPIQNLGNPLLHEVMIEINEMGRKWLKENIIKKPVL